MYMFANNATCLYNASVIFRSDHSFAWAPTLTAQLFFLPNVVFFLLTSTTVFYLTFSHAL